MMPVKLMQVKQSPKIKSLLGEIMMSWSQLEFDLQVLIWNLSEVDSRIGMILTQRQGVSKWMDFAIYLINLRYKDPAAQADWVSTNSAINKAQGSRNGLTHDLYSHTVGKGVVRTRKVKDHKRKMAKTLVAVQHNLTTKELRQALADIMEARTLLSGWQLEYIYGPIGQGTPSLPPLT